MENSYLLMFLFIFSLLLIYDHIQKRQEYDKDIVTKEHIQNYLANPKNKRPFLWVHIPYEFNTRHWINFMERKTKNLNQPYLEICLRSIISKCDDSFNICIIDDSSFKNLIPDWNIDIEKIPDPTLGYIRQLAITKLIYLYGGISVPISFVCLKDLLELYVDGTEDNKMFICENINTNISATFDNNSQFISDSNFIGAEKENPTILRLIEFMQRTISNDYTSSEIFLGEFDRWCNTRANNTDNQINKISGKSVGVKTLDNKPVGLENLLDDDSINLDPDMYGIWIPMKHLLRRINYGWFLRMSIKQILESNFALSKYMILAIAPSCNCTKQ